MKSNIDLDDDLLRETLALAQATSVKEVVHLGLRKLIRSRKKKNFLDLAGQIQLDDNFDWVQLRKLRHASN